MYYIYIENSKLQNRSFFVFDLVVRYRCVVCVIYNPQGHWILQSLIRVSALYVCACDLMFSSLYTEKTLWVTEIRLRTQ